MGSILNTAPCKCSLTVQLWKIYRKLGNLLTYSALLFIFMLDAIDKIKGLLLRGSKYLVQSVILLGSIVYTKACTVVENLDWKLIDAHDQSNTLASGT